METEINNDYKGDKLLDHYSNISPYLRIEYTLFNNEDIPFPFYYRITKRTIPLTSSELIDHQVYRYLNSHYNDFNDADKLIVRLNCQYNTESLNVFIYSVYLEEKENTKVCRDFIDYTLICLSTDNLPSALFYLNRDVWKEYPISQQNFIILMPVLNSGFFTYYKGTDDEGNLKVMVNPAMHWNLLNYDDRLINSNWDMDGLEENSCNDVLYDAMIRSIYDLK